MNQYTPMIEKALKIAYDAHHGQVDKGGVPYIYHPAAVAGQMHTEEEIITALLHDVVEDTAVTLDELAREGFSPAVLEALKLLTHAQGSDYNAYLSRIANNPLALAVKLADIAHNSNPARNASLPPEDAARYKQKYDAALRFLHSHAADWGNLLQEAADGKPESMLRVGIERYYGADGCRNRAEAFRLISAALIKGLAKIPWASDYSELLAAYYLMAMLLRDDDNIATNQTEPFWFEKPFESASKLDLVFMYATGRGAARDLEKAAHTAWLLTYAFFHGSREVYAEDRLFRLLQHCADYKAPLAYTEILKDW